MELHASGEDYLETILVLQKKTGLVRSADVARHLEVSKPSVCHAVATLKKGGFLLMDGAVSYTHLDVYKRQPPIRRSDTLPGWTGRLTTMNGS